MDGWLPTVLGTVAGLLSTSSFVPQVMKAWQEGDTEAISKRMYIVTVSAFVLWTIYGFVIGSLPIIVFNTAEPRPQRDDPGRSSCAIPAPRRARPRAAEPAASRSG